MYDEGQAPRGTKVKYVYPAIRLNEWTNGSQMVVREKTADTT